MGKYIDGQKKLKNCQFFIPLTNSEVKEPTQVRKTNWEKSGGFFFAAQTFLLLSSQG
jgi:hypothetical protein